MMKQSWVQFPSILLFSISTIGCSSQESKVGVPALFDTKTEAEKAAKDFNCEGAHKMGEKWMPCEKHELHRNHHHQN